MTPRVMREGGAGLVIRYCLADSPLGKMLVATTDFGICAILFGRDQRELEADLRQRFSKAQLTPARGQHRLARRGRRLRPLPAHRASRRRQVPSRRPRHCLSAARLEGPAIDPPRPDPKLRRTRPRTRQTDCLTGRRCRLRRQPNRHRRPLPSPRRLRWLAYRLPLGPRPQTQAPRSRARLGVRAVRVVPWQRQAA